MTISRYSMHCSIYKITDLTNQKIYIGQTWTTAQKRFKAHKELKNNGSIKLHHAMNSHNRENFKVELLTFAHTQEMADYWEIYFIEKFHSRERNIGYNLREGGSRGKLSEETKKKISIARTGTHLSEETKQHLSDIFSGRIISDETKKKMSVAQRISQNRPEVKAAFIARVTGKLRSEETRKRITEHHADFTGENHPQCKFSNELIARIKKEHNEGTSIIKLTLTYNMSKGYCYQIIRGNKRQNNDC